MKKIVQLFMMLLIIIFFVPVSVEAKCKVHKIKETYDMNISGGGYSYSAPTDLSKYNKVKVKSSNSKVISAKYVNHKELGKIIRLKVKKAGKVTITVKLYQKGKLKKIYKTTYTVIGKGQDGYKKLSKKAFKIQNDYRRAKGSNNLEWSEELYQFALYRLKTSGYDKHKNLVRDTNKYFGDFVGVNNIYISENLASGPSAAKDVMLLWKGSKGHYRNLLRSEYKCGAIAKYKENWCAVFSEENASELKTYKNVNQKTKAITIKRFDSVTNEFVAGSFILYYEEDNRWNTTKCKRIGLKSGLKLYLEVGKTYVFKERDALPNKEKVDNVIFTVTKDGSDEVVLKDPGA